MKFSYHKLPLIEDHRPYASKKSLLRPIIPIVLENNGHHIRYSALIDSGADCNIFPLKLANILSLDPKSGEQGYIHGISGQDISVSFHPISIEVGGIKIETIAGFC